MDLIKNPLPNPHMHNNSHQHYDEAWPSIFLTNVDQVQTQPNIPIVEKRERAIVRQVETDPQPEIWIPPVRMRAPLPEWEYLFRMWGVKLFFLFIILYGILIIFIFLFKLLMIVIAVK